MHLVYHPKMHSVAERVMKNCDTCQRQNNPGPQYGHLPPQNSALLPWEDVALDLIGPWTVNAPQESYEFYALTCINTITNFPDAIRIHNKTASNVGMQFENLWLSRYPRPLRCMHDRGTESGVESTLILYLVELVAVGLLNGEGSILVSTHCLGGSPFNSAAAHSLWLLINRPPGGRCERRPSVLVLGF
jgi:hypothetical protein